MKNWMYIVLALVIGLSIWVRFFDLEADPPRRISQSAGAYFDGYDNAHSARSYVLFGDLRPDEWDPVLYAPPFVLLQILWFKVFPPSILSINAFSVFFSTLSLLIGIWCFRRFGFKALFMAAVLLGMTFPWVHFSRVAMFENIVIFFMALTMLCIGWEKITPWRAAGAGAFAILAYASKANAIYFLPSTFFAIALAIWQGYLSQKDLKGGVKVFAGYIAGSLASLIPWLIFFRLPDAERIAYYGEQWYAIAAPANLSAAIENFLKLRTFHYMAQFDYLFVLGFGFACIAVLVSVIRPSKVPPLVLLWSLWLGGCILVASVLKYSPPRYIVPAYLPAYCLITFGVASWTFSKRNVIIIQGVIIVLACVHFLDENAEYLRKAIQTRQHTIAEINNVTGALPEGSVVAGISALFATADTDHVALRIDPRRHSWFNKEQPVQRFGVTHMLLTTYTGNKKQMFNLYPNELKGAKILSNHIVCDYPYTLYELVPQPASESGQTE